MSAATVFISWGQKKILLNTPVVTGVGEAEVLTGEGSSSWLPQTLS